MRGLAVERVVERDLHVVAEIGAALAAARQAAFPPDQHQTYLDLLADVSTRGDIAAAGGKPNPNDCVHIKEEDVRAVIDRAARTRQITGCGGAAWRQVLDTATISSGISVVPACAGRKAPAPL